MKDWLINDPSVVQLKGRLNKSMVFDSDVIQATKGSIFKQNKLSQSQALSRIDLDVD